MDPNILSVLSGLAVGLLVDTVYGWWTAVAPFLGAH